MLNATEEAVLHESTERRPSAGRPSLLSSDQSTGPDNERVLSRLDGHAAPARPHSVSVASVASVPAGRRGVRLALSALAVAAAGVLGWLALGDAAAPDHASPAVAQAQPPARAVGLVAVPMGAAAVAAASASGTGGAPLAAPLAAPAAQSGTAAVQDELSNAFGSSASSSASAAPSRTPPAKTDKQDLASLLDKPVPDAASHKKAAKKKPAPDKAARAHKPGAQARPKPMHKQAPADASAADNDVALLAALLAHTKPAAAAPVEEALKRCATHAGAAESQRCRARACRGEAKDTAACKSGRVGKAAG
jgi:hypothetical protein